jgi:hypothetical protein
MYDCQYGVSLDDLLSRHDPLKQFQAIRALSSSSFLTTKKSKDVQLRTRAALIAAHKLSNDLLSSTPTEDKELDIATLTRNRSVYFSNRQDDLPIIIDTGCSR